VGGGGRLLLRERQVTCGRQLHRRRNEASGNHFLMVFACESARLFEEHVRHTATGRLSRAVCLLFVAGFPLFSQAFVEQNLEGVGGGELRL